MEVTIFESLAHWGPLAIFCGLFVWWTWQRENRLSTRITNLEAIIEDRLMDVCDKSTKTIAANTEVNRELVGTFQRLEKAVTDSQDMTAELVAILKTRPCAAERAAEILERIESFEPKQ